MSLEDTLARDFPDCRRNVAMRFTLQASLTAHLVQIVSVLNGLKLVAAKQQRVTDPTQLRRAKLLAKWDE